MSLRLNPRTSQYLYPQLDLGARTIRLIELFPGAFSELPIRCRLIEQDLSYSLPYKALSYSWKSDDASPDVDILCNSKHLCISANLHAALQRLRASQDIVRVWVDAICINQQNDSERANQVGIMRQIYQNSSEVLIWLGQSGRYDDMGDWMQGKTRVDGGGGAHGTHGNPGIVQWFGDQRDVPKLKSYFSSALEQEIGSRPEERTCDIFGAFCVLHLLASGIPVNKIWHLRHVRYSARIVNGLNAIMGKAWWRRIWVVQETIVAKNPVLYYGNLCAPWRMFALAAVEYDTGRVRDKLDGIFSHLNSGQSLAHFTRVIMEVESTRRSWEKLEPMAPLTVLRKFRTRLATDPRDKVFAVLGLIRSWGKEKSGRAMKGVAPDYTVPTSQVFFQTTEALIRNTRSLAALVGALQGGIGQPLMPSWVTDWNYPPSVNEHVRVGNIQLYDAAKYLSGSVTVHGQSILETPGSLIDRVDYVGRVLEDGQGRNRAKFTIVEWQKSLPGLSRGITREYIGGGSLYAAFWRTLCSDLEFAQYADGAAYIREFRRLPEQEIKDESYARWLIDDEQSRRRTSLVGGIWVEPTSGEIETESKKAFQYLLECASGGRRFFRTSKGYIGTGPADTNLGDSVAVLMGSRVPFILRADDGHSHKCSGQPVRVLFSERSAYQAGKGARIDEDEARYCHALHQRCHHVVGDAYVHGLMTGEIKRTNEWKIEPIYMV